MAMEASIFRRGENSSFIVTVGGWVPQPSSVLSRLAIGGRILDVSVGKVTIVTGS